MAYDPVKAAEYATSAMNAKSLGKCAYYIRKAINAGGIPGSWGHAYQYLEKGADGLNPLERNGFNLIDHNQGLQVGDIGVLNATKDHKYGHIQMWNGNQWVSDFGQNAAKMGPYAAYANGIAPGQTLQVFRHGAPTNSMVNVPNPQTVLDSPLANRNTFWDGIWNDYNSYKKPTEGALSYREGSPLYNTFAGIHNLMANLRRN